MDEETENPETSVEYTIYIVDISRKKYERNVTETIVNRDGILWLNEKHIEGLDYKNLWVTKVKYLSGHRKHRYELVDEQKEFLNTKNCQPK